MIDRVALMTFGLLLLATGIAWRVEPVKLLAGLIAVPTLWAILTAVALITVVVLSLHGVVP